MKNLLFTAIVSFFLIGQAKADEVCWVSYEDFERMVPHADLISCPRGNLEEDEGFCRLNLDSDTITIYQFRYGDDGQLCLVRGRGYSLESFLQRYGTRYALPE